MLTGFVNTVGIRKLDMSGFQMVKFKITSDPLDTPSPWIDAHGQGHDLNTRYSYANPVFWVPVSLGKVYGVLRPLPNR